MVAVPALADAPTTRPTDDKEQKDGASDRLSGLLERLKNNEADHEESTDEAPEEDATEAEEASDRISPADLIRQMKEEKEEQASRPLVPLIDMSIPLQEKQAGFSFFGGPGLDLRTVLRRLDEAENDPDVKAVLLTFYNGGLMNFAQAQEIRAKLDDLRRAGKRTFAYADTYDTVSYLVASACTDVVLMDGGELFMPGVAVEPMFYKGTLDKLGVTPDYVQVGEYKGADEPYTRSEPSPELTQEMEKLVESLFDQIVADISGGRSLPKSEIEAAIDRAMTNARQAQQLGLIDHLSDADGLSDIIAKELGDADKEPRMDASYAATEGPQFDPDNPFAILQMLKPQSIDAEKPSVALVYAQGVIVDGTSGGGGLLGGGEGVNTEYIRRAMRLAERDDEIEAIVLRIDSPGGSALASEAMYQAIRRVAEEKPVIVSIGGVAASGGYYLAVAGDEIYADPSAIIGSIGVVGGKLVLDGLYDKVGLSTAMFTRGRNADLFSSTEAWDDGQRRLIRNWMKSTYDQFTERVEAGRGDRVADVDEIARGRIFLAAQGKKLGMVDHLGGLEDALAAAAEKADLGDDYDVIVLPGEQPNPFGGGGFPLGQVKQELVVNPLAEALQLLPPGAREAVSRFIVVSELLEDRPVILIAPFSVRIH
ncbi:MAG: signal peptide peptidase SppA [Planctomycetota bacterium]